MAATRPLKLRLQAGIIVLIGAMMSIAGMSMAWAEGLREIPKTKSQVTLSFAPLVRKVAPAVVNIYTRKVEFARSRSPLFDDPFFRRFFGEDFGGAGPVRKRVRTSLGSGVILDPKGLIVTNVHVIKGADQIRVVLADRREFDAKVILIDKRTDLAVLKINAAGEELPHLVIRDSDALEVGDLVLAIGNPFGVGQTVTSGIVSALARTSIGVTDYRFFIQTDAAINPGNSGGALVSIDGGLVGINTAIYSKSGGSIGIGFAVPSAMVRTVLAGASTGRVVRPWFGAKSQRVTAAIARSLGLARPQGVLVNKVYAASPAASAGLRTGDVVIAVNGHGVNDPEGLRFRFATLSVGGTARLNILRSGKAKKLMIALNPAPEIPPRNLMSVSGENPLSGAVIGNLSPALADELSMPPDLSGVVVIGLKRRGYARRAGLKPRDIIRAINGDTIKTVETLGRVLARQSGAPAWRISLERKGRLITLAIGG
ncbi:MAG: Do family serine endopeptidase [Rhodospirillales bacterium]|nr:Do family serine endopeptidase [Rhodospirillales bacterium]MBT5076715.1 Do family serine endopeptidase [Rhodospirillales bacterium]MBT5114332.1 Do family serine endopeptidase [Rhodospirillales bacterium]MBT5672724.1 Do family serine endopeptidase [Rhodospirillales bacterium]MBT6186949.1 Do family serine endopeptidase [Rhodospirillales bacterium]